MRSRERRGIIYVLTNEHMRGIVKIGQTTRDVTTRVQELSRPTGVPTEFELVYSEVVSDVDSAESEIHAALADFRVNKSREFFRVSIFDAIQIVKSVSGRYRVDEEADGTEVEILPSLEQRMRRWLRRELVSVKFVQFPDLCFLRVTEQPDILRIDAYQTAIDLRVIASDFDEGCDHDDPYDCGCPHYGLFNPVKRTIRENVAEFLRLDAYSMIMVGLRLLSEEAADHVADKVERAKVEPPLNPGWRVSSIEYDMWGSAIQDNETLLARLRTADADRLGDRRS
jgi:hypothetical protein